MTLAPNSLVLVVVMNQPRDLEIARLLGWYRIPLRSAPKIIAVDYLAFYLTAAFGAERWRIQYLAPVLGYELTTRLELLRDEPDHPHAHHEYYKVQIGPLQALEKSVPAGGWRRITFLYTTGQYLLKAQKLNDLVIASDERPRLWQSLRERADQTQGYLPPNEALPLALDPALLNILLGFGNLLANDSEDIAT
jgi:hypothetical protein